MYPGTIVNWFDQSEIGQETTIAEIDNKPLFMVVSSFDKGPENLQEVEGTEFNNYYGTMYFEKHGQNAIQAQRIIDAGGRLLVKRVCADDATVANLILTATVTASETQKLNEDGEPLYLDEDGTETTTDTGNPINVKSASIKWAASSVAGCKTFEEVETQALELLNETGGVYPLMIFVDNGRGVSKKAIRLIPDYNTSKNIGKTFYTATVFEGTASTEATAITVDPTVIYANIAYGLDRHTMTQVKGEVIESVYDAYIAKLAESTDIEESVIRNYDLIYGYTYKGSALENITIDAESVDINTTYGIELKEGTNGVFGDKPVGTEAWAEAMRAVWAGEVTDEVWDVDQHKICAICDANLPLKVKEAIATFVTFREDCMFFRDLGIDLNSFLSIRAAYERNSTRNRYISDYATSYMVKDPVTKKNIKVTMMYDFVECLVNHFDSGAHNPLAGTINRFILRDAIKGTINYTPIVTPTANQKQAMDDIRVNYAIFENDDCVVQTLYTSQDAYTQLSYSNNVLAIQEVVRAVRTACPRNRYSLVTGTDMTSYAKAVSNVLQGFSSNFDVLEFGYTEDPLKASQKIFYATIKFAFHMWPQTEIFDLFAINND